METKLRHINIPGPTEKKSYTTTYKGGNSKKPPDRNREEHGQKIRAFFSNAWDSSESKLNNMSSNRDGIYLEFVSSGLNITASKLENIREGIRICNIQSHQAADDNESSYETITVHIPRSKRDFFIKKLEAYQYEDTKGGNPKNNDLVAFIERVNETALNSFWTGTGEKPEDNTPEWCEVWLQTDDDHFLHQFENLIESEGLSSKQGRIRFPERIVKLVYASKKQLIAIIEKSDHIAEIKRAATTANYILSETNVGQIEWAEDILQRTSFTESDVSICLLDTGVNRGHMLLEPYILEKDMGAYDDSWGFTDRIIASKAHGTLMAGTSLYGDIRKLIDETSEIIISHRIESIKILPDTGDNPVELWGHVTQQAISKAEINAPQRSRVLCMAVSATQTRELGKPTSWSAAIDQAASGAIDGVKRLVILAGGNFTSYNEIAQDPDFHIDGYGQYQLQDTIHDPGQSWNSLTVGAVTGLIEIREQSLEGYIPVSEENGLSPFTTASIGWESKWPNKPDVVFEGGNLAYNESSNEFTDCDDLSLITTSSQLQNEQFTPFIMTSAACALAANFAAKIQSKYPNYWPETIRALIIHSAEWPEHILEQVRIDPKIRNRVIRSYGYGIPDLEKALYCASNSLTLVAESEIQPFEKGSSGYKTKDMDVYEIPWPKEILLDMGEARVQMRITLSYFIEPGPGEKGWRERYRYASHGLRFKLNAPNEDKDSFLKRVNKESREDENDKPDTKAPNEHWTIGQTNRNKGSIHSDIWEGNATELAASNLIAVLPTNGWWKERKHLKMGESTTRYSLIVSISTPETTADIYTAVKQAIEQTTETKIQEIEV